MKQFNTAASKQENSRASVALESPSQSTWDECLWLSLYSSQQWNGVQPAPNPMFIYDQNAVKKQLNIHSILKDSL